MIDAFAARQINPYERRRWKQGPEIFGAPVILAPYFKDRSLNIQRCSLQKQALIRITHRFFLKFCRTMRRTRVKNRTQCIGKMFFFGKPDDDQCRI